MHGDTDLYLEFVVFGTPKSSQSNRRGRDRWKAAVAEAAKAAAGPGWLCVTSPVQVRVVYYHRGSDALDVDNMLKPINDALQEARIMVDDTLITDQLGAKRSLETTFILDNASAMLTEALARGDEFVHIVLTPAPNPEVHQ